MNVPYVDYKTLNEFYTVPEVCKLLDIDKQTLRKKCEQYSVELRRNEIGEWGLVKYDVRKLHNALYYEDREDKKAKDDPWA